MENCKFTKLKGSSDNPNLKEFNTITFNRISGETGVVQLTIDASCTLHSDGSLTVDGASANDGRVINAGSHSVNTSGTYFSVEGAYNITRISTQGFSFDAGDLSINNNGTLEIAAANPGVVSGDISNFKYSNKIKLTGQYVPVGTTTIDITSISKYTLANNTQSSIIIQILGDNPIKGNLVAALLTLQDATTKLTWIDVRNDINVNVNDLVSFTALKNLRIDGTFTGKLSIGLSDCTTLTALNISNTPIGEDLSVLLDALFTNGKTSGSINTYLTPGSLIDGVAFANLPKSGSGAVTIDFSVSGWAIHQY